MAKRAKSKKPKKLSARQTFAEAVLKFNYDEMISLAQHARWAAEAVGCFQKNCVTDTMLAAMLNKWARDYQ